MDAIASDGSQRSRILILAASYFIFVFASLAVIGLIPAMSAGMGVAPGSLAWLVTTFSLAFVAAAIAAPLFIQRWRLRTTLMAGLLGLGLGSLLLAFATDSLWANVARVLQGASAALIAPTASVFAVRLSPPALGGRALAMVYSGVTVASAVGVPLASWIGDRWRWSWIFFAIAAGAFILAWVSRFALPEGRFEGRAIHPLKGVAQTVSSPVVNLSLWTTMLRIAAQFGCYTLFGALIVERFGMSASAIYGLLLAYGVAGVVSNLLAGVLNDRLGTIRTLRLSAVALVASYLGLALLPSRSDAWMVWLAVVLWGLLGMLSFSPQQKFLAEQGHPSIPSVAISLNAAALYTGMAVGSAIAGTLVSQVGIQVLVLISLFLASASVVTAELSFLALRRRRVPVDG